MPLLGLGIVSSEPPLATSLVPLRNPGESHQGAQVWELRATLWSAKGAQRPLGAAMRVAVAPTGRGGEGQRRTQDLDLWAPLLLSPGAAPPGKRFCVMG